MEKNPHAPKFKSLVGDVEWSCNWVTESLGGEIAIRTLPGLIFIESHSFGLPGGLFEIQCDPSSGRLVYRLKSHDPLEADERPREFGSAKALIDCLNERLYDRVDCAKSDSVAA